ncbi:MAG: 6,7-dimethyl-8-ribityllumazine synthase [Pirellulales bacterium]
MPELIEGQITGENTRVAVVVSRYNETITGKLESGAVDTLSANQVADNDITVVRVPGAWELPVVAARLARSGKYHAVICLGAVIKGETTHDLYINQQVSHSLGRLALECDMPILFGLLTCNTLEQAIHRSGGNVGNKGIETAEAALEMIQLMSQLPSK